MKISKNVMLARMEITSDGSGNHVQFDIEFIKADGSKRKMKAMNHVKHPNINREKAATSGFKFNLKEKNALLLWDVDGKTYKTVKVDSIIFFNGMEVIH